MQNVAKEISVVSEEIEISSQDCGEPDNLGSYDQSKQ
jgi:hypothetical protein